MIKTSTQQCLDELSHLFERQISELQEINDYLTRIKNAVAENDIEEMNNLVAKQKPPVAEVEKLQVMQQKLVSNYNFEATGDGLAKCIEWCDLEDRLVIQYENFKQELTQLQHSLQISDLLVSKGQNRVRQSLQLLTGQIANTRVYTSDGHSRDSTDRRSIAHV